MPAQKSLRRHNRGESLELIPTHPFGFGRQPAPLVVVEPRPSIQLFPQDPDLLLKVFDDILLVTVDPSSETDEKQLERVHRAVIHQPPVQTPDLARAAGLVLLAAPGEVSDITRSRYPRGAPNPLRGAPVRTGRPSPYRPLGVGITNELSTQLVVTLRQRFAVCWTLASPQGETTLRRIHHRAISSASPLFPSSTRTPSAPDNEENEGATGWNLTLLAFFDRSDSCRISILASLVAFRQLSFRCSG